jgi:hypothetical protein
LSKLSAVERDVFDQIRLDMLSIYVSGKKIAISHEVGIYNQILGHFKLKNRSLSLKLDVYIAEKYNATVPLANSYKAKWVDELVLGSIPNLYANFFKIRRLSATVMELYTVCNGNILEYLGTSSVGLFRTIKDRCQFWDELDKFCFTHHLENPAQQTIYQLQRDFMDAIRNKMIEEVSEIKVLSNDRDCYCLSYYDLRGGSLTAETPAWDSFLAGMNNDSCRRAFRAWVYSVFVGDNYGRQALILHGTGETGKSAVGNAIYNRLELVNPSIVTTLEEEDHMDKFSAASYVHKRLVLSADNIDRGIVRNKIFKNLTGKDKVTVREMGKDKTSAQSYAKVLITTNLSPFIDADRPEEVSRCMLITLDPIKSQLAKTIWQTERQDDWQACLADEIDDFITQSEDAYNEYLMPDLHNIRQYEGYPEVLGASLHYLKRDIPVWWDTCLVKTDKSKDIVKVTELYEDYVRFVISAIPRVVRMRWMVDKQVLAFIREIPLEIHKLENFNVSYLRGYKFKDTDKRKRITALELIDKRIEETSVE